jgi:DNA-binding winged helix-turn-helix (wHTH) protein/tetratricopeptide (TPR) repeat protein
MTDERPDFLIGDRRVFVSLGRIKTPNGSTRLEPRVMDLLVYLAHRSGRVISRDDIIRDVWRATDVTDDVITRSISQIRRALSDDWRKIRVIETIPKRGYRLLPEVEFPPAPISGSPEESDLGRRPAPIEPIAPAEPAVDNTGETEQPPPGLIGTRPPRALRIALLATAVFVTVAAIALVYRMTRSPAEAAKSPAGKPIASVLVVPFVASDGSDQVAHLSTGLNAELINALSTSSDLRVIGASSAKAVIEGDRSPLQAARELQVAALITGTIRAGNNNLLIAVSMIDPASGRVLHGHDYQFPSTGIISASQTIARDVAQMLGVHAQVPPGTVTEPTSSPAAYQLFLQAHYYLSRNNAGAIEQGIDYLRQAVKLDPNFAAAYASLGTALMLQVDFGNRPPAESAREAQQEVSRALALQPEMAEAHAAQGLIYYYTGRLDQAAESLRRATAIRPNYAQAHLWLGRLAQSRWQIRRSIAAYERAREIEPLSPIIILNSGLALDTGGHYNLAERELRRGLLLQPQFANLHWALGYVLWHEGRLEEAHDSYAKAVDLGADASSLYGELALLQVDLGAFEEARQWILRGERIDPNDESLWLARLGVAEATHRSDDIQQPLDAAHPRMKVPSEAQIALASLDVYRGDFASARRRFDSEDLANPAAVTLMRSPLLALAGHAPALDAAVANLLGGDTSRGRQMLREFHDTLSKLRSDGLDSPGFDYEEAVVAALGGDAARAHQWLQSAQRRGWREDWGVYPKLASSGAP